MARMPTLFLSHGSPMHAIAPGAAGEAWASLGKSLPRPRAILIASAHWETAVPMVTGNPKPQTIHDFGGFPQALYEIQYPAPGASALAAEAVALMKQRGLAAGIDGCRGLDHGAWVPLRFMYPDADIPTAQLAVQPGRGTAHHVELGRALAPLADDGVLVIGSGHTTHNLRDWMQARGRPQSMPYADAFASWMRERLEAHDVEGLIQYRERAPEAERAHPTEEHLLPLFIAWGAAGTEARATRIVEGMEGGVLSMDSYRFDTSSPMQNPSRAAR